MKFKKFTNCKKRIKYEVIIYVDIDEVKIFQGIFPVLKGKNNTREYHGLLTKDERFFYDYLLLDYANYEIIDKDIDDEHKQIFIYLMH